MKRKNVISRVTPVTATPEALIAMAHHKEAGNRMTNMKEILCHNAVCFTALEDGSYDVGRELVKKIGRRALMIFSYALSSRNECVICGHYFKKIINDMGYEWETFEFTEEETDLLLFAQALAEDPNHVPDDVYEALQARYDEETMVILVTHAVFTLANNYFNNIVGTEIYDYLLPYVDGDVNKNFK